MNDQTLSAVPTSDFLPEPPLPWRDIVQSAALALFVTLYALQFSMQYGRLTQPVTFDDVIYFVDAAKRVDLFREKGFVPLLRDYAHNPPHSLISTLLAAGSFLLLGRHDWAPYAASSLLLFALLVFVSRLTTDLRFLHRTFLRLFVCAIPISLAAVSEFRPDFAAALFTVAGIVWTLSRPLTSARARHVTVAGALFGVAVVAKPSFLPFTCFMWGCSVVAVVLCEMIEQRSAKIPRSVVRNVLRTGVAGSVVSLVYLSVGWRHIAEYIYLNIFTTQADIWTIPGGWKKQAAYFVFGAGGQTMLGGTVWLLITIVAVGSVFVFAKSSIGFRVRWAALLGLTAIAYGFVTINKVKGPTFGQTFQLLLVMAALVLLRRGVRSWAPFRAPAWSATAGLALFVFAAAFSSNLRYPATVWLDPASRQSRFAFEFEEGLVRALREHEQSPPDRIFFTVDGAVNAGTLEWALAKDFRLSRFRMQEHYGFVTDLSLYAERLEVADFVIAAEPGATGVVEWVPSSKLAAQTLALVRESPRFREVARFPTPNGRHYFLFSKKLRFGGWGEVEGLLPTEGPYPELSLPRVRWAAFPETRLFAKEPPGTRLGLRGSCRGQPGQEMTIMHANQLLQSVTFTSDDFVDFLARFEVNAARYPVVLSFNRGQDSDPKRAVLFRKLELSAEK